MSSFLLDVCRLLWNSFCSANAHNDTSLDIAALSADCVHQKSQTMAIFEPSAVITFQIDYQLHLVCVIADIIREITINNAFASVTFLLTRLTK